MRIVNIESATHLWSLLKSKEKEFESNKTLKRFIYVTESLIKSCQCGSDYKSLVEIEFKNIKKDQNIIDLIKKELSISELNFPI